MTFRVGDEEKPLWPASWAIITASVRVRIHRSVLTMPWQRS